METTGAEMSAMKYADGSGEVEKSGYASETEDVGKPDGKTKKLLCLVTILILLGLVVAIVYIVSNTSDARSTASVGTTDYASESGNRPAPETAVTEMTYKPWTRKYRPKILDEKVVCALGSHLRNHTTGPSDGLCDYLFYDSLYLPGLGTLLEPNTESLQWFLNFVRTHQNGSTQYGISFNYASAKTALDHVNKSEKARATLREMWDMGINHFGLLRLPAIIVDSYDMSEPVSILRRTVERYFQLWQKNSSVPIYRFVGVDFYQPFNVSSKIYRYLMDLTAVMYPDAIIIRSHYTIPPNATTCKITTTSSYNTTFNYFEASMVESLKYALAKSYQQRDTSLLVSFTMRALKFYSTSASTATDYDFGKTCESAQDMDMLSLCTGSENFTGSYDQSLMTIRAVLPQNQSVIVYDNPQTILRKMCLIRVAYPYFHLGMALFDIDFEDTEQQCKKETYLNYAAGYWRLEHSSAVMKTVLRNASSYSGNSTCP